MFKWIKVLSRLSQQDDVVAALELKVNDISARMDGVRAELIAV